MIDTKFNVGDIVYYYMTDESGEDAEIMRVEIRDICINAQRSVLYKVHKVGTRRRLNIDDFYSGEKYLFTADEIKKEFELFIKGDDCDV